MMITELTDRLEREGFNATGYWIGADEGWRGRSDCLCLQQNASAWSLFYTERGERRRLELFTDEGAHAKPCTQSLRVIHGRAGTSSLSPLIGLAPMNSAEPSRSRRLHLTATQFRSKLGQWVLDIGFSWMGLNSSEPKPSEKPLRQVAG
jgi:hypothetical protein